MGGKRRVEKEAEKMDKMEEEEHSPLVSVIPDLDGLKSASKPDEQPTQDNTEMNNNDGIYKAMMYSDALENNEYKNQHTSA
jgi:hypothetical protein